LTGGPFFLENDLEVRGMARPILAGFLAAAALLAAAACRPEAAADRSKFTVETVDGVRLIHNQAPQRETAFAPRLELQGKIGKLEGREDEDILFEPADAVRLPNGDILVLESGGCVVKRFNERYELLSSFGRKGLGPGDFVAPYLLALDPGRGLLYVADSRISWFRTDGTFVDSFRPARAAPGGSSVSAAFRASGLAILAPGRIVLPGDASVWGDPSERRLLSVYDERGTVIRSFGRIRPYDDPTMTLNANIVYFSAAGGDCYAAFAHQNRIDRYSADGALRHSADRPIPYDIRNVMRDEVFTSGAMTRVFSWPSVTSVSRGLAIDGKGRIWVQTYLLQPNRFGAFEGIEDPARCFRFDVFGPEGHLLFSLPVPSVKFSRFSISGDRMYLIDPDVESCVYEFRILDPGDD
jgi:hypothetical protein